MVLTNIERYTEPSTRKVRRAMAMSLDPECVVPGHTLVYMDANDPPTTQAAFAKRVCGEIPRFDPDLLDELRAFVQVWLAAHIAPVTPLSFEEWLLSTTYPESRKQELRDAHDQLRGMPPSEWQRRKIQCFQKTEGYPALKNARMINSRSDYFKAWSGPYFKAIEQEVYRQEEFIKHVPVCDRAAKVAALKRSGLRYWQTDFTAFEAHFVPEVMRAVECELYRHCLPTHPAAAAVICETITGVNDMRTRGGFRVSVKGRRMSGDMCTSLGNGFTNLMLAKFCAAKQGYELSGFVEGDDGLFATRADLKASMYAKLGFRIKIDEVAQPTEASFCGMVFADSGEIIKDPKKFIASFGWSTSFVGAGPVLRHELLRAKALSAVYEAPQCPIFGAMARRALVITRGVKPRFINDGYHQAPPDEGPLPPFSPSADTRSLFERLYGVSVETQLECERRIGAGDWSISGLVPPPADLAWYTARYVERKPVRA